MLEVSSTSKVDELNKEVCNLAELTNELDKSLDSFEKEVKQNIASSLADFENSLKEYENQQKEDQKVVRRYAIICFVLIVVSLMASFL